MHSRRMLIAGFIVVSTGGVLAAQTATHHPSPGDPLTATSDCRAGCQRNFNGCQESSQAAVFNASPGYHLLPDTVATIGQRKGSPGLRSEPRWIKDPAPPGSSRPTRLIVRPDLATCHGEDGDTQGITWYDIQVLQAPN